MTSSESRFDSNHIHARTCDIDRLCEYYPVVRSNKIPPVLVHGSSCNFNRKIILKEGSLAPYLIPQEVAALGNDFVQMEFRYP
jgi:hypothetical protein